MGTRQGCIKQQQKNARTSRTGQCHTHTLSWSCQRDLLLVFMEYIIRYWRCSVILITPLNVLKQPHIFMCSPVPVILGAPASTYITANMNHCSGITSRTSDTDG